MAATIHRSFPHTPSVPQDFPTLRRPRRWSIPCSLAGSRLEAAKTPGVVRLEGDDVATVTTMIRRVLGCGLALLMAAPLGARERLTIKVSPTVSMAPANLIVRTIVEADSENRAIEIVAESEDFYRSSEVQLDGDRAPRTTTFEFRSLPGGTYYVTATLLGASRRPLTHAKQQVNVIASGTSQ